MDYKTYLDFVLAMENKGEPQSLQYLFRVLDTRQQGYLSVFSLNFFFRAIQEEMRNHGQDPVPFEDVKDEIFDMVQLLLHLLTCHLWYRQYAQQVKLWWSVRRQKYKTYCKESLLRGLSKSNLVV